ncbi:TolC family protein [Aquipseudomonas ullengensis]|uniref:TolC family protein n=1 Tax=Aquipseudomonas ullengensis TaxID=2759166 RepID=A0A7W4QFC1_9GAMM|nr:TolC family protein [Pseudomonas ullengensis]MBB2496473.1 TolC family protein [Pseudomonas ullengensis]
MVGRPAQAAPVELSLADALSQAQDNNPALSAASRLVDISLGERQQAGLLPNPELSWEVEDTRSDTRTTTTQITQPIELGGKRGARIEQAEKGQSAASVELERSQNALRADVILSFYDNLQAEMRVALAEQSLVLAERGVQGAEGRVKAGKVSPVELTRAQVQLSEVRLELRRAQRDQASAHSRLQAVIGGGSAEISVVGDATSIPEPPTVSQLWSALGATAEMRLARLSVEQQEASFELEKTQRIPDLNVSLGSQYSAEDRERVNVVGLSMPIPLFNRNQGNIFSAARRADQARDLRNATELRLRADVQQAMEQWIVANEEIKSLNQTILPSAKSAVDSATRGFEMGKFGFLDVLDAQRTLIGARTQYVDALASATAAWVQLERVYGDVSGIPAPR